MSAPSLVKQPVNTPVPRESSFERERDIHKKLEGIRTDEIFGERGAHDPGFLKALLLLVPFFKTTYLYIQLVIHESGRYFSWLSATWAITITEIFSGHPFVDPVSYLFFVIGGTLVLPVVLILCLVARFPPLTRLYYAWSRLFGGGLGIVNSGNANFFKALTKKQVEAAKMELHRGFGESKPDRECPPNENARVFDYDIAKLLLQIAAVVYEHESTDIRNAAFGTAGHKSLEFLEATGDGFIRTFAKQFNIEYHPISELENKSSAFGGLFWDPDETWIIVALKGTGPIEFGEWLSDLDSTMTDCSEYIPNFKMVHRGFKERVFPNKGRLPSQQQHQRPYNTISLGIQAVANHLHARHPDRKVNVWFTGHSLRCATASLIYARMLMKPEEIGDHAVLRDAYLFAAPIVCDSDSVKAFNDKMFADTPERTMWRITSNDDFVATGLPEFGDYQHLFDPKALQKVESQANNFFYAHLGAEIILYDRPSPSTVAGNHLTNGHPVQLHSYHFTPEEISKAYDKQKSKLGETVREKIGVVLQLIPVLGRFIAHSTVTFRTNLTVLRSVNASGLYT
ncbi:hypothetical protein BS47DRAFT_1347099, partial [Hydnum rufescens UP504]